MTSTLNRPRYGTVTLHGPRRRPARRTGFVALLLVAAGVTAYAVRAYVLDDSRRHYLSSGGWPRHGQAAYQLGDETPHASPDQQPVPIASLAKVMTALLVLHDLPLHDGEDGPRIEVTRADVADTAERRTQEQSLVDVRAGEVLTERQALLAILLPSANNVAVMLARFVAGSVDEFVSQMNAAAEMLGMRDTTYTDPSGYDEGTRSTAKDQLVLAGVAAGDAVLPRLMATRRAELPVAGTVENTDILLGHDGFTGMKTGSDDAAGGCFMFRTRRSVDGDSVDMVGVVLGQPGHDLILAGQYAARQLAGRTAPGPGGD